MDQKKFDEIIEQDFSDDGVITKAVLERMTPQQLERLQELAWDAISDWQTNQDTPYDDVSSLIGDAIEERSKPAVRRVLAPKPAPKPAPVLAFVRTAPEPTA
jgi:hypothetical protein